MAQGQIMAEEWLAKNRREMISCPYQPGQLLISKKICGKRYRMGRREDFSDLMKGNLFNYAYKTGLSLCRNCEVGKKLAVSYPIA
jgi:hypothetical protein